MADPTGETDRSALRLEFDRRLMLQFRGSTITSDAGLLAYRELDNTLRLTDTAADMLADARTGKNGRHRGRRAEPHAGAGTPGVRPHRMIVDKDKVQCVHMADLCNNVEPQAC